MVFAPCRSHNIGNLVQGEHPENSGRIEMGCCFQQKTYNISEMGQEGTNVTTDD